MKIAINCWVLRNKQLDGIGFFTVNTFQRMIQAHPETTFILLCDKHFNEPYFSGKNVVLKKIFPPYRHPLLYIFYFEFILPFVLRRLRPDLFVSAEGFLSLCSGVNQLPIIYDLNFEHFPENISFKNRLYFRFFFPRFARKAKRIATISDYSKQDIVKLYNIDQRKIDNVSCGINNSFEVLPEDQRQVVREKYSNGAPYFFFVGSMHPRKNVSRLIAGFNAFKKETGAVHKLVLGGSILWKSDELKETYQQSEYKDDIIFTGRLSDEELKLLLGSAFALTFVPVFEGFGLPIVEAFEAGVPVITSNVTSLPEVAGDAAIYVDPFDPSSIASGLRKIVNLQSQERTEMIRKGFERKLLFSWNNTAELLWNSMQRAMDS
jgi:glycosyltransferase involved in cell wall biosynthesis